MRINIILFDLRETLEHTDILLPGVREMLQAVQQLHDANGQPPDLGLVSDFSPQPEEIVQGQQGTKANDGRCAAPDRLVPLTKAFVEAR
jgi:hypothetical protein